MSIDEFMSHQCSILDRETLLQVAPTLVTGPKPIIYHVCSATNYCAAKRQATAVPLPDNDTLKQFKSWFDKKMIPEITNLLYGIVFDFESWFNHLSAKQQTPMREIYNIVNKCEFSKLSIEQALNLKGKDTTTNYTMFVKSEKQLYDGSKAPKNRCICSPNDMHKYVLGPVTWQLEHYFKHFPGYCGGKNWGETEKLYNKWRDYGLNTVLQLDGSGFDRTQHTLIKRIVDQQIYKLVANYVEHVPKDLFLKFACMEKRKVQCSYRRKEQLIKDGYFIQDGAVFSGSCDTT